MATVKLLSDDELSSEARAVFDDIRKTRQSDFVNNFWRALAHDPKTLRRTWESVKEVMAPGALEPKIKEMLYVAVSVAHGCNYCIHSHTAGARAKGMTEAEYAEILPSSVWLRRRTGWSPHLAYPLTRRSWSMHHELDDRICKVTSLDRAAYDPCSKAGSPRRDLLAGRDQT
jgi:AhpD family alkylhydroperoxidase